MTANEKKVLGIGVGVAFFFGVIYILLRNGKVGAPASNLNTPLTSGNAGVNFSGGKCVNQTGSTLSQPIEWYTMAANTIYNAVSGCNDDYETVLSVFQQIKNPSDEEQLVLAFGFRELEPCWLDHPICAVYNYSYQVGLADFLMYQLSADQWNVIFNLPLFYSCGQSANPLTVGTFMEMVNCKQGN